MNERMFLKDIIDPRERDDDPLLGSNDYYKWMYLIAKLRGCFSYAEIGTYRGYSAYSVLKGIGMYDRPSIFLFDNESFDGAGSLKRVTDKLRGLFPNAYITEEVIDTQKIDNLRIHDIDLFYVDGDHSYESCQHDLRLAAQAVASDGIIIVDDMKMEGVKKAVTEFCSETGKLCFEIPHFRGMAILVG